MNEKIKVRTLNTEDLFTLIDMSKDMDVSNLIDQVMDFSQVESKKYKGKKLTEEEKQQEFMRTSFKGALIVIQNLGKAKGKFYKLLADVTCLSSEEIKNLPLMDTIGIITEMFNQKEFQDFFLAATNNA